MSHAIFLFYFLREETRYISHIIEYYIGFLTNTPLRKVKHTFKSLQVPPGCLRHQHRISHTVQQWNVLSLQQADAFLDKEIS